MPEMPEVEIIRRSLDERLRGRKITQVEILLSRQIKWPEVENFRAMLTGHTINAVNRVGKYIVVALDSCELVIHLRMTGHLVWHKSADEPDKYARIRFHLDDGAVLTYGDARTLGVVYALKYGERYRVKGLSEMGREPLSAEFTVDYLAKHCAKRHIKIKQLILEQKTIGGVGDI